MYLARTSDDAYYCGYATDVAARLQLHNAGGGAKILRGKRPVCLGYVRRFSTKSAALRFEAELKKRSHAAKRLICMRWLRSHARDVFAVAGIDADAVPRPDE
ncbi:MAG: GIY-YIG nuclease family protein [Candidatus Eremiobacteraeota bacterium]|nr:GIY-YIG nuclease family protein [Candidatus Eremiobacteraeota bacterium]